VRGMLWSFIDSLPRSHVWNIVAGELLATR
jgi:hypothetical protein